MSTDYPTKESPLVSYLLATAEQLDIALEDAEIALDEVLETFEAAANGMETLEAALDSEGEFDQDLLVEVAGRMRHMLRTSVVRLQFQDRLHQRLALASRELRQLAADNSVAGFEVNVSDLRVPRSVSSLYDRKQMLRIISAAGTNTDVIDTPEGGNADEDDIELF